MSTQSQTKTQIKQIQFNVAITGLVSSGKSSFLNSLVGAPVANVAKSRETAQPTSYMFSDSGSVANILEVSKQVFGFIESNTSKDIFNGKIKSEPIVFAQALKASAVPSNTQITDFPGIGDERDPEDIFFKQVLAAIPQTHLVLWITDANRPFLQKEELNYLKKIQAEIKKQRDTAFHYCDLAIVAGKFDDEDDTELEDMVGSLPDITGVKNIFRYSAHIAFARNACPMLWVSNVQEFKNILKATVGKSSRKIEPGVVETADFFDEGTQAKFDGDWDGLYAFLKESSAMLHENVSNVKAIECCRIAKVLNNRCYWISEPIIPKEPKNYYIFCNSNQEERLEVIYTAYDMKTNEIPSPIKKWSYCTGYNMMEYALKYISGTPYYVDGWNFGFNGYISKLQNGRKIYDSGNRKGDKHKYTDSTELIECVMIALLYKDTSQTDKNFQDVKSICKNYDKCVKIVDYCKQLEKECNDFKSSKANHENLKKEYDCQIPKQNLIKSFQNHYTESLTTNASAKIDKAIIIEIAITEYNEYLITFAYIRHESSEFMHIFNESCIRLLRADFQGNKALLQFAADFTKEQKYDILPRILQYGCATTEFGQFSAEIDLFSMPAKLARILDYNGVLDSITAKLYKQQSIHNFKLWIRDPTVGPDAKIGERLFAPHYYDIDAKSLSKYSGIVY